MLKKVDVPLAFAATGIFLTLATQVLLSPAQYKEKGESEKAANTPQDDGPWWTYSGFWIAWFTVVLTGSTVFLWLETRKVSKLTMETLRIGERGILTTDNWGIERFADGAHLTWSPCCSRSKGESLGLILRG
jgi:hypothetical protein